MPKYTPYNSFHVFSDKSWSRDGYTLFVITSGPNSPRQVMFSAKYNSFRKGLNYISKGLSNHSYFLLKHDSGTHVQFNEKLKVIEHIKSIWPKHGKSRFIQPDGVNQLHEPEPRLIKLPQETQLHYFKTISERLDDLKNQMDFIQEAQIIYCEEMLTRTESLKPEEWEPVGDNPRNNH